MRFILPIVFAFSMLSSAFAATVVTTNAKTTQSHHYYGEYTMLGLGDIGAHVSIWSNDNWKTAMLWLRPKAAGRSRFTDFIVDCGYYCVNPGSSAKNSGGWSNSCPCSELFVATARPFRFSLSRDETRTDRVDAWDVMQNLSLRLGFFGNELFHTARISLDDRSVKRYNFALWDSPDRRGYSRDGMAPAAGDQAGHALTVSAVPLPASALLLVGALAGGGGLARLARRPGRRADPSSA